MYYKNYPFWYFPCNYNMHPYFIVIYLKLVIYQLLTNMRTRQQFNSIYSPAIICAGVAGPESLTWVEGNLNANFGILLSVLFHLGCDAQFQDTLAVLNSDLFPLNPIRLSLCLSYIPYITIRKMPSEKSHSMNIDLTVCASLLLRDWESPAYPGFVPAPSNSWFMYVISFYSCSWQKALFNTSYFIMHDWDWKSFRIFL